MERFRSSIVGYNRNEVNRFVDETLKEYSLMLEKLKRKDDEILYLQKEVERYRSLKNSTREFSIASEASNRIRSSAQEEARSIVEEAQNNASRIINDALIEAEHIQKENERLRKSISACHNRLRSILQSELETIDDIEKSDFD